MMSGKPRDVFWMQGAFELQICQFVLSSAFLSVSRVFWLISIWLKLDAAMCQAYLAPSMCHLIVCLPGFI